MPNPTPTAVRTTSTMMATLTRILLRLLILARHWHDRWLSLLALAFFFQWPWPGHTWPSALPLSWPLLVDFMPQLSSSRVVRLEIMASMSVSKGFRSRADDGVETSEGRRKSGSG